MDGKQPAVYIMSNKKNGTLYVGVTSNLSERVFQHKQKLVGGFTEQHNLTVLAFYELCDDMRDAISREKQLKGGSRKKKLALIEKDNPSWRDLSGDF